MRRLFPALCAALLGLTGCAELGQTPVASTTTPPSNDYVGYQPAAPLPNPAPNQLGTEAGGRLMVQLDQPLGADISHVGDRFQAPIAQPVFDGSGRQLIPAGAQVVGHVVDVHPGSLTEPGAIALNFDELDMDGRAFPLAARVIGTDTQAHLHGVNWKYVVGGGVAGGVLGAILGHRTGAVAGAALGAGAGTLISLGKNRADAKLPAGTALAIELQQPIEGLAIAAPPLPPPPAVPPPAYPGTY